MSLVQSFFFAFNKRASDLEFYHDFMTQFLQQLLPQGFPKSIINLVPETSTHGKWLAISWIMNQTVQHQLMVDLTQTSIFSKLLGWLRVLRWLIFSKANKKMSPFFFSPKNKALFWGHVFLKIFSASPSTVVVTSWWHPITVPSWPLLNPRQLEQNSTNFDGNFAPGIWQTRWW